MSSLLTYRLVRKGLTIVADVGFGRHNSSFQEILSRICAQQVTKIATYSQLTCPKIDESLGFGLRNLNLSSHQSIFGQVTSCTNPT